MHSMAVCLSSQCQQPPQKFIVGFLGRACCFIVVFFAGLFKSNCSTFNIGTHSMLHMAWFCVSVWVCVFSPRVFCVYFHNVYPNRAWDTPQRATKQQRLPLIATDSNFDTDTDTNSRLPQSKIQKTDTNTKIDRNADASASFGGPATMRHLNIYDLF